MAVFITGMGVISAIGQNLGENYRSLQAEKSGIQPLRQLKNGKQFLAGAVRHDNNRLSEVAKLKRQPASRTAILGTIAAKEAWGDNRHSDSIRTGLISATSVGGMDVSEQFYKDHLEQKSFDPKLALSHDSGNTTEQIARELGITGYINTLSTACSSGANAIMLGARLIEQNKLDRILVGGADALTDFTINGFNALMIYDADWCKPFDKNRKGLNLGEGAGFLLLESEKSIRKTGNQAIGMLAGWANASDAYHQTASSPDGKGATLAMQSALQKAGIGSDQVSYINAHGTGTENNDLSESVALSNIFKEKIPPFSSTKSFTGHTLAAAGAIEAVFSVLCLMHDCIFPNLNFRERIAETGLEPQSQFRQTAGVEVVLSNSFGFGGNNTSLVFERVNR